MKRKILGGGLAALVLGVAGCGGGGSVNHSAASTTAGRLDTARVARSIQASIQAQRHIHARVSCPRSEPLQKGLHFVCFATTSAGQTPFVVTEVDNRGSTTYVGK